MRMMAYFYAGASALLLTLAARGQTTAFTYQGRLNDGLNPATGIYDFRFQIYNATNGAVAGPLTNAPVAVTNGLFLVTLDFGPGVFDGNPRTLEIGVRNYGVTTNYTVLSPRQAITSTPYAIQALNAVSLTAPFQATNLAGTLPDTRLSTNVALLNGNQTFSGTNNFSGVIKATNLANVIAGNGAGLANLAATNLTGTIPDARLSANVPLQSGGATFAGTVNAPLFAGSGYGLTNVPGAFFWVTVAGTSQQVLPNVGYIVTNNVTPVTLTLPVSPNPGDVYKIAGVGAAGWIIAQNAGQTILAGNVTENAGQTWKAGGPATFWSSVASSADGTKLVATINGNQIYTSANSGATWVARAGNLLWSSVASSADGTKLVATVGYTTRNTAGTGQIYTSTDSGQTWTPQAGSLGNLGWSSVASSADGTKLVASVYAGGIYGSANSGQTWTLQVGTALLWTSVASSADGTKLVAVEGNGQIYTSTNSGVNWTARGFGGQNWTSVACSADGNRLAAAATAGQIYLSTDAGVTWTVGTPGFTAQWTSVASSADGSHLTATSTGPGYIYTSADSGATWLQRVGAPNASWADVATAADGSQLVAVTSGSFIYLSSNASTSTGTTGYLSGAQHTAIELIYVGNGQFLPLNHEGVIRAF
jgi:photosystem II stability/assembly factor-like uncharacterized protein